jgi:O-methyltransferase involved in polyketide biosynthesis
MRTVETGAHVGATGGIRTVETGAHVGAERPRIGQRRPRGREIEYEYEPSTSAMKNDLSITALYTSQVWAWGKLSHAELLATDEGKRVFDVTNAALALARKPPLRYALLHRHAMIDYLLHEAKVGQVVELAAGLSRRGVAHAAQVRYIEVDLPAVIERKRELLARSAEGREALGRLELVAADVETIALDSLVAERPVMVIAEGLLMYLTGEQRRRLFERVSTLGDVRLVFDLVPADEEPAPGFAGRMLEAAMKRFTGGRTFERDARTREQILGELRAAGFTEVAAHAPVEVARAWQLPEPDRATTMVVFSASRATRS